MSEPGAPMSRRESREAGQKRGAAPAGRARTAAKGAEPADRGGIAGIVAKHPIAWLASAIAVVFLLLATGALFAGAAVGNGQDAAVVAPTNTAAAGRSQLAEVPAAGRLRTCSVAGLATDPRLMAFSGAVMNASTGELLFDRNAATPVSQGSVLKVLTAAAALNVLGPDYQLSTKVFEGSTSDTIVLVGGGDPTISALNAGESVYSGAPKLDDLADQVLDAHPGAIKNIVLDTSMWGTGDKWDSSWKRSEQTIGYHSEVTALQVDGDRANPAAVTSPRSTDPIARAGILFAEALGLDPGDVTFSNGAAVTTKPLLGEVKSQPVSVLINQMLLMSDNTLAETLARVVSKVASFGGTAASLQQAITSALAVYGVDTTGLVIRDGSGLSTLNLVPPQFMTAFMIKVLAGGDSLNYVYNSLSVAGKTGGLASRFTGTSAIARSNVFAKTGWLDTEYSLAGIVNAADGTQLTFAFYAIGAGIKENARTAIDVLTTGAYTCGDNLSNN